LKFADSLLQIDSVAQIAWCCAVFVPVEWLLALHPGATFRRNRIADVAHGLCNAVILRVPLAVLVAVTILAGQTMLPEGVRNGIGAQPLAVQAIEATLIGDFGVYIAHRLLHSRLLWRFHAIHHSAENLDWLVSFRVHPVEMMLAKSFSLLPSLFIGLSPAAIGLYLAIYGWMSLLNHANVRITFGPLRHIIVGPEFHHWHHAKEHVAHDRNFAAQLVIWDWLLGTLHSAGRERPASYGVSEDVPHGFIDQLAYPFRTAAANETDRTISLNGDRTVADRPRKAGTA